MVIRILLVVLLSVGMAGMGGIAWLSMRSQPTQAEAAPVKVEVLTALHAMSAGNLVKPGDLGSKELAVHDRPEGALDDTPENRKSVQGGMVRRDLAANDVVMSNDITRPGDHGFLAAVLSPGMSAITIGVDAVTGTPGLIWPGDHVDVIMTQTLDGANIAASRRISAETVMQDARVIAIDQRLVQSADTPVADLQKDRTVTLEVTPEQSARLTLAARLGKLSLSVRSSTHKAANPTTTDQVIWAGDVSHALPESDHPVGDAPKSVRVYSGGADMKEFHL